ncbi:MAG TPA: (d)CMP kinase, partial [Ktedonobacterales bacterium]|nr:(d)CMP kinase [Ktedonobacterales bacterium]
AGVGKSTIGERLARRLGFLYVDSGAFYRALTVVALQRGVAPDDAEALTTLAKTCRITITAPTSVALEEGHQYTTLVDGEDITLQLRLPDVEGAVSTVSRHPPVREALRVAQRQMADEQSVVMVGRDIGTVVLPHATLKIYLTTSVEHRAQRRHGDLVRAQGDAAPTLEAVQAALIARDAKDAAQMRPADDAITINNDHLEADDVVERISALLAERTSTPASQPIAASADDQRAAPDAEPSVTQAGGEEPAPQPPVTNQSPATPLADATSTRPAYLQGRPTKMTRSAQPLPDGTGAPWFYAFARVVVAMILPLIARLRTEGVENIPREGPVMLAADHMAWADIPLVSFHVPRITHYMAKIELFHIPVLGAIVRLLGAFPVHRGEGDRESLRTAERLLTEGEVVIIFPEGHRSGGHLARGLPGVALIALRANAPIVPIAVYGTERTFKGFHYGPFAPRVTVRYGKPFYLSPGGKRRSRDDMERGVDEIMRRIAALLPPEYRGVFADEPLPSADEVMGKVASPAIAASTMAQASERP